MGFWKEAALVGLMLGLSGGSAMASYCGSAATVASSVNGCEDNDKYITSGEACLDKLDADTAKATSSLRANFSPDSDAKQKANFESSLKDYAISSASLAALIAQAKQAQLDIASYQGSLEMPEDSDEQDVTGGDPEKYAMSVDCYGEAKKSLDSITQDFAYEQKKLEAAKAMADAGAANSGVSAGALDGNGSSAAPVPVNSGSGGKVTNQPYQGSDISGTQPQPTK